MSWINMLSPLQWAVMLAVPPLVVLLYFLKLRRTPVEVPSTYLWQRTIEDLHVNSIWQRLRRNLLLLLQLLVLLALVLACLRPGYQGQDTLGERSIFLIDNSSSMQAEDVGTSRLAEAKRQTLEMIDGLKRGDAAMVIAFSDRADVRQGFTSDKRKLREAVNSILPTNRPTDLNEALRAASGLANPGRTSQVEDVNDIQVAEALPASLYIYSDGGFAPPQLDLGNLTAEYIAIGSELSENVGILAFSVERNSEHAGQVEAFASVKNFGSLSQTVGCSLYFDEELVDASSLEVPAGETRPVSFEVQNASEGRLKLVLEIKDDLQIDNVAFAGLDPPRQLDVVLVTNGNSALEAVLKTAPAMAVAMVQKLDPAELDSEQAQTMLSSGQVDLFIFDNCAPKKMPAANTLFLGATPPGEEWELGESTGPLFVIDTNRSHPMLQYVDMGSVQIVQGSPLTLPQAGTELLRSDAGVLLGVAPRESYQDAVLGMPLIMETSDGMVANTDWSIRRSFPVFWLNALEYLGGAVATAGAKTVRPGEPVSLTLASRYEQTQMQYPDGRTSAIDRAGQSQVLFTQTEDPGFYLAQDVESERLLQMFTVNLFSEQESDIRAAADVQIGLQKVAANEEVLDVVRVEYWRWLLVLALGLLSVEWYLYNRRVAV